MNVLFVSPEVGPIIRAGGLGDVVGALPLALKKMGIDVRILCPFHKEVKTQKTTPLPTKINLNLGSKVAHSQFVETKLGNTNIPVYLLRNDFLFDREGIYSDRKGDYVDNSIRSFALCKAALWIEKAIGWKVEIFHSHDWMAASLPAYLNAQSKPKVKEKEHGLF